MSLIDTGPILTAIYDFAGRCVFLSHAWLEYTGTAVNSQLGRGWSLCVHPDDQSGLLELWRGALASGGPLNIDVRIRGSDGRYRWFKHNASRSRRLLEGKGERWLGVFTEVTQLKEQLLACEDRERRKNEFFAFAAHELRSPLVPLVYDLHKLERCQLTAPVRELHERMRRQVTYISRLIEDLLDVARVTAAKVQLDRSTVDICECLQQALEFAQPLMEEKGQRLLLDAPQRAATLECDRLRLVQALSNLLLNAAKYSPPGATICLSAATDPAGSVQIAVQDNGPGLSQDALAKIFRLYEQNGRHSGGLGVGLALAKRLVELHGGTLEAKSDGPGLGSTFTITLPNRARD